MISVCVTLYNRCRVDDGYGNELNLFPDMVDCLIRCNEHLDEDLELVVTDWGSSDMDVETFLEEKVPFAYQFIKVGKGVPRYKQVIDRGMGRNLAAKAASGKYLLFTDADMLFNHKYILTAQDSAREHRPYVPIIFYALNPDNMRGTWDKNGSGNCMILKGDFQKTKGWPCLPHYKKFHGQDVAFRKQLERKFSVKRQADANIYHPFHPGKMIDKAKKSRRVKIAPRRFKIWDT